MWLFSRRAANHVLYRPKIIYCEAVKMGFAVLRKSFSLFEGRNSHTINNVNSFLLVKTTATKENVDNFRYS